MRIFFLSCITLLQISFFLEGASQLIKSPEKSLLDKTKIPYTKPPQVSNQVWKTIIPHMLPEDHPIKPQLDRMFTASRILFNASTLNKAGFINTKAGRFSKTVVTTHPKLKGYVLKLFRDDQKGIVDWEKLMRRIRGADSLRATIKRLGYEHFFQVPQKWIYPLPLQPTPPKETHQKFFILVTEEISILNKKKNKKKWKSSEISPLLLDAFFVLLGKEGLTDSVLIKNVPFSEDGKVAFIDTELFHLWPVHYERLFRFLSEENRNYWNNLIIKNDLKQ